LSSYLYNSLSNGVTETASNAHRELRQQLVENNTLHTVLSLPSGVFKPYADVKTSVLFFSKGGETKQVMFLQVDADGYKLDAQHFPLIRLGRLAVDGILSPLRSCRSLRQ
jgi:type I restriction-modification system DNA methylase subunit